MFKYFRALYYFMTGRFAAAAEALHSNQYVMAATYDKSIEKTGDRYNSLRNALSKLIGIEQDKVERVKSLSSKLIQYEKVKVGATAKAKDLANKLKSEGQTIEQIKANPEYLKHITAFQDAASSAKDTETEISEIEKDLEVQKKQISVYKVQLQQMQRSKKQLEEEKQEAIADVAIAKEMQKVNDIISGVAEDTVDKDLASAREARKQAKNKAHIAAELSGNDAEAAQAEYINFAAEHDVTSEFDALIGLVEEPKKEEENLNPAKLPE